MHPADMGKRGDQLVRVFDEPVELVVTQHCSKIANSVVRIAESLAMNIRQPRRYCIIDGADTVRKNSDCLYLGVIVPVELLNEELHKSEHFVLFLDVSKSLEEMEALLQRAINSPPSYEVFTPTAK